MPKLAELASLIRSKNAGPFMLTFDILFEDRSTYERVKSSGLLTVELVSSLYKCPSQMVRFFECDNALGFKYSIPRPRTQGDVGDADLHGGHQNVLLMNIDIP